MGEYIVVPGTKTIELPPLLLHSAIEHAPAEDIDSILGEAEDMLPPSGAAPDVLEQRRFELALLLREQYKLLVSHWLWGDSILEWVRQCEFTFEGQNALRSLLHPDVWPHAGRSSFVTLLMEKEVPTRGISPDRAVGWRVSFRHLPPIECCSSSLLVFLHKEVAASSYRGWAEMAPPPVASLPPDRFHFDVVDVDN